MTWRPDVLTGRSARLRGVVADRSVVNTALAESAPRLRGVAAVADVASARSVVNTPSTTVPNVELLEVGEDWMASSGVFTFTAEHLVSAVGAQDDPSLPAPIVKLGHTDPRFNVDVMPEEMAGPFDGQPALGRVVNMRITPDGMTLLGDLVGLPTWLAQGMATLYPRRSVEGSFRGLTATGHRWPFVCTGVALLGASYPAIGTLADIELLLGDQVPPLVPMEGSPTAP